MRKPLVIGHRGACGHRPEHTLESYALAIELGADFIEPDLVFTRDGALVARHENEISGTTDVADHAGFAARKTTKHIDGVPVTGFFTEDFTLAELKTLRARERVPKLRPDNTVYDGRFGIPTFEEVIELARAESQARDRTIGIYPETKHPTYFASIGLPFDDALLTTLRRSGYTSADAPVFIQSFEVGNLRALKQRTDVRLVQLIDAQGRPFDDARSYADLVTPEGLSDIASYAACIGVNKQLIIPRDAFGASGAPTRLIEHAHAVGLGVHAWTFRSENYFLPADLRRGNPTGAGYERAHGDSAAEYRRFLALGVDGVFSDFPGAAVAACASPT